jgi:hypothetical protein
MSYSSQAAGLPSEVNDLDPHYIKGIKMSDWEFNQWFSGFIDGEANFAIRITKTGVIAYTFSIGLHIDDKEALEFIKNKLNCGHVYVADKKAIFYLSKLNDLKTVLIPLLDKFPLNGIKYLDYLAFKEAINIKFDASLSNVEKYKLITELKDSMNSKRVKFEMPDTHTVRITPY